MTDWDAIDNEIAGAARATDDALAARISSVTTMSAADVKKLFPKEADAKKLAELMTIVRGATSDMEKVNTLTANIETLAGTVVTLLKRFP
ncbi:MAG: hypothetical protein ACRENU_05120 [Gemmatimonadaceae bacterium]